jgi:hypothetical protein
MVIANDDGPAFYAVEFQGMTYEVENGQERIKINGVNFQIDTTGYAPEEEPVAEEISEPEPEEAPKLKKSRKSKK